jgi:predicted RNA-binding protein
MCLVAVHLQRGDGTISPEPAFEEVARIECREGHLVIQRMLDRPEVVRGRIRSVDLIRNEVVVEVEGDEEGNHP